MTMLEQMSRQVPEPYPYMYLDGYTPYEILHTTSRKMYQDYQAKRAEMQAEKEMEESVQNAISAALEDLFKDWK